MRQGGPVFPGPLGRRPARQANQPRKGAVSSCPDHCGPQRLIPRADDPFHWELIVFMVSWAPYGGPSDEDALPRFGMNSKDLATRFNDVVQALARMRKHLSEQQHELLQRAQRLLPSDSPRSCSIDSQSAARSATGIGLSPTQGHWRLSRGLWHWREDRQDNMRSRSRVCDRTDGDGK